MILCAFLLFSSYSFADKQFFRKLFPAKTVYVGVNVGGGATTWKYLVDTIDNLPPGEDTGSTPTRVDEGGASWGVVLGFDVSPNFALELQYMRFADSHIYFSGNGEASYGYTFIISKTQAYSLSGKFYLPVGHNTHLRAFSAVGAGVVVRSDPINKHADAVAPYMSAGLSYNFTKHMIAESGFQYYTGFGASEILPVKDFIPFAWDAYFRVAYQF